VFVGRVGRPHGVAGELYVDRTSLSADELRALARLEWRGPGGTTRPLRVQAVRATHDRLLVCFDGVTRRETAAPLTNGELWADAASLPDPGPDVAYTFQLVGLRVVDEAGGELGTLRDVTFNAGRALYVVEREGRERMYPGHPPFVTHVDLAGGVITMSLPPGFEELDT